MRSDLCRKRALEIPKESHHCDRSYKHRMNDQEKKKNKQVPFSGKDYNIYKTN